MASMKFITELIGISLIIILMFLVYVLLKTYDYGFNQAMLSVGG